MSSLLPLHYANGRKKRTQPRRVGFLSGSLPRAGAARKRTSLSPGTAAKSETSPGRSQGQAANPCYLVDPPQVFDEPGTELDADAQVWKTYIKETDELDRDRADVWDKTLDVLLIFAALFSAISTAFVIESYRKLKEDPADASAETLRQISQTLLLMANGTQTITAQSLQQTISTEFQPSLSTIIVNALWFLSLTLSVLASLAAMLAKEWCFMFTSGRTGSPAAQARRRQQRWDGLIRWRMEDTLMVLPSVIQLALLLFVVGLSIFLWDIHTGVAIPVVVIAGVGAVIYGICTVLPFWDEYCPYGTTLTRISAMLFWINLQQPNDDDNQEEEKATSQALSWLVNNCETPRSIDVALQSVAGASDDLPVDILESCGIPKMIRQRFTSADARRSNSDQSLVLYSRALLFLEGLKHPEYSITMAGRLETGRLEILLWSLQFQVHSILSDSVDTALRAALLRKLTQATESQQPIRGSDLSSEAGVQENTSPAPSCIPEDFWSTPEPGRPVQGPENEVSLPQFYRDKRLLGPLHEQLSNLCEVFTLQCAKVLRDEHDRDSNLWVVERGTSLLEEHFGRFTFSLSQHTIFLMLLSYGLVHNSILAKSKLPMRFVHLRHAMLYGRRGLTLAAFALSRGDYLGWSSPTLLAPATRVERAIDFLLHVDSTRIAHNLDITMPLARDTLKLGVLHLLSNPRSYNLDDADLVGLAKDLSSFDSNPNISIPTLPPNFNLHRQVMIDVTSEITNPHHRSHYTFTDTSEGLVHARACLKVLCHTYSWQNVGAPTDVVYVFVLQCLFHRVSPDDSVMGLFKAFPFPTLSDNLADLIFSSGLINQLGESLEDNNTELKLLARSQLWLLTTLFLRAMNTSHNRYEVPWQLQDCLQEYDLPSDRHPSDIGVQRLERVQKHLTEQFSQVLESYAGGNAAYFRRILFCMLSAEESPMSDARWKIVGGFHVDNPDKEFEYLSLAVRD